MIYPNTSPSGVVGGDDNKRKLQQMLSKLGSMPMFSGGGRSASVSDLPGIGAPGLSFNPFLKMLAGRPGETFQQLPGDINGQVAAGMQNSPPPAMQGFQGSSVPTTSAPMAGASQAGVPINNQTNALDPFSGAPSLGHYNDTRAGAAGQAGVGTQAQGPTGLGVGINNPLYHTLLQLAMYGQDR